jgi:hypothetical protein
MLRSHLLLAGIAAASLGAWVAPGCGSSAESNPTGGTTTTTTTSSSSSSSSSGAGGSQMSAEPPGPPAMTPPDGTGNTTFAISQLFLGDTDRCTPAAGEATCTGTPDALNGWKNFGFNIDGIIAAPPYSNLCKPVDNAAASVHQNGNGGIDNSFGQNILQIILSLSSTASQTINQDITSGKFTVMLSMVNLGAGANYNPLLTRLYGGADLGSNPKFDGTDSWPVLPSLLNNPSDITSAKVQFMSSYVNNQTWVSGSKGSIDLNLSIDSFSLDLTIGSAQIAFDMDSTHHYGSNGTIAGVLNTQTLINELQKVAGAFDPAFCDPTNPTFQSIATEISQASDILSDGSQDPTKTCDGISIGLGFNAALVQLGSVAAPTTGPANPCADAGAGGSGG